jgi:hypothetical protein
LPYERIDDLQLAVLSTLVAAEGDAVTVEVKIDETDISVSVGPLAEGSGADEGLRLVLERLVDSVEGDTRDEDEWLTLSLRLERSGASADDASSSAHPH